MGTLEDMGPRLREEDGARVGARLCEDDGARVGARLREDDGASSNQDLQPDAQCPNFREKHHVEHFAQVADRTCQDRRLFGALMSGHGLLPVEFRPLPLATGQHLAQMLHRVPHVGKAGVERRQAKAQDVRVPAAVAGPEVANHAACNQRLHDGKGAVSPGQADL